MKKTLFFIFFLGALGTLPSLESNAGISLGVLGFNFNINKNNSDNNMYFYGRLVSFTYKSWFGLGATVSPIVFHYNNDNDIENISLTFANLYVNYNLLYNVSDSFILGPFVSINAVKPDQPDFFDFSSGIVFSMQGTGLINDYNDSIFSPEIFYIETGFKYNKNDKFVFTATISVDLITALYVIGTLFGSDSGYDWESANNSRDKEPPRRNP
jgi:hypothetical protein